MKKYQIIFDFDGVILNSHNVKTDAFFEIFKEFGNIKAKKAQKYHLKNNHVVFFVISIMSFLTDYKYYLKIFYYYISYLFYLDYILKN